MTAVSWGGVSTLRQRSDEVMEEQISPRFCLATKMHWLFRYVGESAKEKGLNISACVNMYFILCRCMTQWRNKLGLSVIKRPIHFIRLI